MHSRRLFSLLALLALLVAPFGRMAAAEAMTMPHAAPMAMAGHCDDMPQPDQDKMGKSAIDCMIACATLAAVSAPAMEMAEPEIVSPQPRAVFRFAGISLEADPPPPRFS